jgi:hypothetical protein
MKKFKHRKTGEIATYQDGILKSSGFCVEIGVEPSSKFWEEIVEKQPLFITEDGIDIYEGDEIFIVNKSFNIGFSKGVKYNNHKDNKFFSSLESVQNYIIENKPCLSLKEVKDCYNYAPKNSPLYDDLINNLELKIKEKNV